MLVKRLVTLLLLCYKANPKPQSTDRKASRKRKQTPLQDEALLPCPATSRKRTRTTGATGANVEDTIGATGADVKHTVSRKAINPVEHWSSTGSWPKEYFEPPPAESYMNQPASIEQEQKNLYYAIRKPFPTSGSEASSTIISDHKEREFKSLPYEPASYETTLATLGSFMGNSDKEIREESRKLCQTLLDSEQTYPEGTPFRDEVFGELCQAVRNRNDKTIIRYISPMLVPSVQELFIYGATHLKHLYETIDERWRGARLFYGPLPRPDYAVGFERSAFTDRQLRKLQPYIGKFVAYKSLFVATQEMYFPFFTCEVHCSGLDVADRENAHSMTLAVRGMVQLFRLAGREKELDQEILAFSISHSHEWVRIYGHYAMIDGAKTTFYRHKIRSFDFTELNGREKWTTYRFTKNLYDLWATNHLQRIREVIDELPLPFIPPPMATSSGSRHSQGLEIHDEISWDDTA
jgi:hypothetical protein